MGSPPWFLYTGFFFFLSSCSTVGQVNIMSKWPSSQKKGKILFLLPKRFSNVQSQTVLTSVKHYFSCPKNPQMGHRTSTQECTMKMNGKWSGNSFLSSSSSLANHGG
jgi:hypothetical protein